MRRGFRHTASVHATCLVALAFLLQTPALAEQDSHSEASATSQANTVPPWRPRWGFLAGGAGLTGLTYVVPCAAFKTSTVCVPVAGPLYEAGRRVVTRELAYGILDPILIGSLGFLHAGSLALLAVGLAGHHPVRKDSAVGVLVTPVLSPSGAHLSIASRW